MSKDEANILLIKGETNNSSKKIVNNVRFLPFYINFYFIQSSLSLRKEQLESFKQANKYVLSHPCKHSYFSKLTISTVGEQEI